MEIETSPFLISETTQMKGFKVFRIQMTQASAQSKTQLQMFLPAQISRFSLCPPEMHLLLLTEARKAQLSTEEIQTNPRQTQPLKD
jgi:hypothetical protein